MNNDTIPIPPLFPIADEEWRDWLLRAREQLVSGEQSFICCCTTSDTLSYPRPVIGDTALGAELTGALCYGKPLRNSFATVNHWLWENNKRVSNPHAVRLAWIDALLAQ